MPTQAQSRPSYPMQGLTPMGFKTETMAERVANSFARSKALLASYIRRLIEARRRRIEHEREFYQKFKAYCRANNLTCVCEDDWKTRS